jgi:integrase
MDILGLDHKPHDTRVTCGTLMELAGIPLNRRKAILGHAQNDITEDIYTRIPIAELVKEINKIALPHA